LSFFQNINHYRNGGPTDEVPFFASDAEKTDYEKKLSDVQQKRNELQAAITQTEAIFRARNSKSEPPEKPDFNKLIEAEGRGALGAEQFERYQQLKKELQALKDDPAPVNKA